MSYSRGNHPGTLIPHAYGPCATKNLRNPEEMAGIDWFSYGTRGSAREAYMAPLQPAQPGNLAGLCKKINNEGCCPNSGNPRCCPLTWTPGVL